MIHAVLWIEWLSASAACMLFVAAAVSDLRTRQVPNTIPLLLLGFFVAYAAAGGIRPITALWQHLAIGVVLLAVGFALYSTGRFGGADGKLIAVAGLWVGLNDLVVFLFGVGVCALLLSLCALLPCASARRLRSELPFAVAIVPPSLTVIVPRVLPYGIQNSLP